MNSEGPLLPSRDALAAVTPLRLIFLGGLLYRFDWSPSWARGELWRVDILNDAAGMVLIAVGVFRLRWIRVHPAYRDNYGSFMRLVKAVTVIGIAEAVMNHFVFEHLLILDIFVAIYRMTQLAAICLFCIAMRWLFREANLPGTLNSWKVTMILFVGVVVTPLAFYFFSVFLTLMAEAAHHRDLGIVEWFLPVLWAVPFVGMYVSTRRLAREAQACVDAEAGPRDMTKTGE